MISEVIDGVCTALSKEFKDCEIYTENIEQGLEEPCFFVSTISAGYTKQLLNRYLFDMSVSIQYFPESEKEKRAECNRILDRLFDIFDVITVDNEKVRVKPSGAYFVDQIQTLIINFSIYVFRIDEEDISIMEDINIYLE